MLARNCAFLFVLAFPLFLEPSPTDRRSNLFTSAVHAETKDGPDQAGATEAKLLH